VPFFVDLYGDLLSKVLAGRLRLRQRRVSQHKATFTCLRFFHFCFLFTWCLAFLTFCPLCVNIATSYFGVPSCGWDRFFTKLKICTGGICVAESAVRSDVHIRALTFLLVPGALAS